MVTRSGGRGWLRRHRTAIAVAVLALLVVVASLAEAKRRRNLYWYDVRTDYQFTFSGSATNSAGVRLFRWGFVMPSVPATAKNAVLRMDLRSGLISRWFEPAIVPDGDEKAACPQYLERGAAGRRYILICGMPGAIEGDTIRLRGVHTGWREQNAELYFFDPPDLARVLVLAPHADDAEIAAFGLYADHDSWIVTITSGGYGGAKYGNLAATVPERHDLQTRLRVWDSQTAARWVGLGPDRSLNLGYPTNALEAMRASPAHEFADPVGGATDIAQWRSANASDLLHDRPAVSSWENLVGDLAALLDTIHPTAVVAPHPALDANRDHGFSTAALLAALERVDSVPANLLLYTNHHRWTEYYPFGPAYALATLPPWFDRSTRFESVYSHQLGPDRLLQKLFALDHMHDLRAPPRAVTRGPIKQAFHRLLDGFGDVARDPAQELSYFRRAVRPNEIFFVYGVDGWAALRSTLGGAAVR